MAVAQEAAAAAAEREDGEVAKETQSPEELKARGNELYRGQDVQGAVELWNLALRAHVEAMMPGGPGPSPLSEESQALERSLYLNLAQGYLRLGQPERTLRACEVVIRDHRGDAKATYRKAEACLALKRFDDAAQALAELLEAEPGHAEATRLLGRVRAAEKADARHDREVARRMCAGASGYAAEKPAAAPKGAPIGPGSALLHGAGMEQVAIGSDLADAAAEAARRRTERLEGGPPPPEPTVTDLDAFRAKVMGRTSKMKSFMAKSRKQSETAQRSVRLDYLRGGGASSLGACDGDGAEASAGSFDSFAETLREELRSIEAADAAAAAEEEGEGGPPARGAECAAAEPEEEGECAAAEPEGSGAMEEMD